VKATSVLKCNNCDEEGVRLSLLTGRVFLILASILLLQSCRQPTSADLQAKPWVDNLEHLKPEKRSEAIQSLAQLKYRPAARLIARRINDVRPDVRLHAIKALGELGDPASVPALQKALSESEWAHRKAAALALGKIGHESAIPILIGTLVDRDQAVGGAAAEALAAFGAKAESPLLAVLSSGPLRARPYAAYALGNMKSKKARQPLRDALAVSNSSLRVSAVLALASFADPRDTPTLAALMGDADPPVAKAASDAIARAGMPAVPYMIQATTNNSWQIRHSAYRVLLEYRSEPGVMLALLAGWDDRDERINRMIRNEFMPNGRPKTNVIQRAKTQILAALGNQSESIRMHALELIEPVVREEDTDAIIALLDDRSDNIKCRAANVLAGIRSDRSRQALRKLGGSGSEAMRFTAVLALASQGDDTSVTNLLAILEPLYPAKTEAPGRRDSTTYIDNNVASKVDAIVAALARSCDKRAFPLLARMTSTSSRHLFTILCRALAAAESPEAFDALEKAAERTDWSFREGRGAALAGLAKSDPRRAVYVFIRHLTAKEFQEHEHKDLMIQELGRLADPRGAECIVPYLVSDREETQNTAGVALTAMKGAAVEGLFAHAPSTNRTLRGAIAFTLAGIGEPAAAAVKEAFKSPVPEVREVAAWTVGQMKKPGDCVLLLVERLNKDESPIVRAACAWAIGQIRVVDEPTVGALANMLCKDASASCRQTAGFALGEIAPTSAIPALAEALNDAEAAVRAVAAGALGRIGDPAVVGQLTKASKQDQSPEVRSAANNALIAMGLPGETPHGKKEQ
jgi:HEAT repeat protein